MSNQLFAVATSRNASMGVWYYPSYAQKHREYLLFMPPETCRINCLQSRLHAAVVTGGRIAGMGVITIFFLEVPGTLNDVFKSVQEEYLRIWWFWTNYWGLSGILGDYKGVLGISWRHCRGDSQDSAVFLGDFRGFFGFLNKIYKISELSSPTLFLFLIF